MRWVVLLRACRQPRKGEEPAKSSQTVRPARTDNGSCVNREVMQQFCESEGATPSAN